MPSVEQITALRYDSHLSSGHSRPCVFECVDNYGEIRQVVTKCRKTVKGGNRAHTSELLCSFLASDLGLKVPTPYLVELSADLGNAIDHAEVSRQVASSDGVNFGSLYLENALTIPTNFTIGAGRLQQAADVFLFDAITQNADRSASKPNLLSHEGEFVLIDHEQGLPFLMEETGREPWLAQEVGYMAKHVFWASLRGHAVDFTVFEDEFKRLDQSAIQAYFKQIPVEWNARKKDCTQFCDYISQVQSNFDRILFNVKTLLR